MCISVCLSALCSNLRVVFKDGEKVLPDGSDLSDTHKPSQIISYLTPLLPSNLFIGFKPPGLCHSSIKCACMCACAVCGVMFPSERKLCHRCVTCQWHHQSQTTNWFPLLLLLFIQACVCVCVCYVSDSPSGFSVHFNEGCLIEIS